MLARNAGVPERYIAMRWGDMKIVNAEQRKTMNAILQYGKAFHDMRKRGVSMAWLGNTGTGKTMLASLLTMHLLRSGYRVLLSDWDDVLADFRDAEDFSSSRTRSRIFEDLLFPDLLIIDEIEDCGNNARREMQRIVDKRYKHVLPVVLIGNLSRDEFRAAVGDRVVSRIQHGGGGIIQFNWDDLRKNA